MLKKLLDHQRCHRKIICHLCSKTISIQHIEKHLKICSGNKEKIDCDRCEYSATTALKMNKHKLRCHSVPKCKYCGKTFSRKWDCERHEKNSCKVRKVQSGDDSRKPLSREEAISWHSSTNITNQDFNVILSKICESIERYGM